MTYRTLSAFIWLAYLKHTIINSGQSPRQNGFYANANNNNKKKKLTDDWNNNNKKTAQKELLSVNLITTRNQISSKFLVISLQKKGPCFRTQRISFDQRSSILTRINVILSSTQKSLYTWRIHNLDIPFSTFRGLPRHQVKRSASVMRTQTS